MSPAAAALVTTARHILKSVRESEKTYGDRVVLHAIIAELGVFANANEIPGQELADAVDEAIASLQC